MTRKRLGSFRLAHGRVLLALIALGFGSACSERPTPEQTPVGDSLLIAGVSIVEPHRDAVSAPRDILIAAGRIVEVADAGAIPQVRAARLLPAAGLFALPGLIDVHAHIGDGGIGSQSEIDRERALDQFVRYGVTTIFVPGGGGGNDDDLARWRERCDAGELRCPALFGSGALITAPGSHPIGTIWNLPIDADPAVVYERGAVAVREDEPVGPLLGRKHDQGLDAIKIIIEDFDGTVPRLSKAKILEIVRGSHDRGMRVFAHVSSPSHIEDAVAARIDGVMHSVEAPVSSETFGEMALNRIFYVSTLSLYQGFFDRASGRLDPEPFAIAGVSERARLSLEDFRATPFETPEQVRLVQDAIRDNLRRAAGFGVPLALGTDVNNPSVFPGYSAHREMALMVEAGLTPSQVLAAATTGGASFLEMDSTLGRIEPGYEADLLILERNPLDSVQNTRTLRVVIHGGRVVEDVVSVAVTSDGTNGPATKK